MRSSRCTFSTAVALHRVFIAPIERPSLQQLYQIRPAFQPHRSFSITHRRSSGPLFNLDVVAEKSRLPRNEEIQSHSRKIRIIGHDNVLSPEIWLDRALGSLDRRQDQLQVMNLEPEDGGAPICRIQNIAEQREIEKQSRKKTRPGAGQKEIELNWAIEKGDLKHRLNTLKKFLEKGMKVEITLAGKRGGRRATEEEAKALVEKIMGAVEEVVGAKSTANPEGQLLKTMKLKLAGKPAEKVSSKKKRKMAPMELNMEELAKEPDISIMHSFKQQTSILAEVGKKAPSLVQQPQPVNMAPLVQKPRPALWAPPVQKPQPASRAPPAQRSRPVKWGPPARKSQPPANGKKMENIPGAIGSNPAWAALMKASGGR